MISETKLDDAFPEAQFYIGFRTPFRLDRNKNIVEVYYYTSAGLYLISVIEGNSKTCVSTFYNQLEFRGRSRPPVGSRGDAP